MNFLPISEFSRSKHFRGWLVGVAVVAMAIALIPSVALAFSSDNRSIERDSSGRTINPNDVSRTRDQVNVPRSADFLDPQHGTLQERELPSGNTLFSINTFRSIDGSGNNIADPGAGAAGSPYTRMVAPNYADGSGAPSGNGRPGARLISSTVADHTDFLPNGKGYSDFLWQWGQFVDHDIDLTPTIDPEEPFDIEVPVGDQYFDPGFVGSQTIALNRSMYSMVNGVREQLNLITSYIDGSNIYGSDDGLAMGLRTLDGTGRLKTSAGNLLPFNIDGDPNVPDDPDDPLFISGDERANEQVALTVMHTLFVREHNYWAMQIAAEDATLDGDRIYQLARVMVAAEMQAITYREFLPALLGPDAIPPYMGYQSGVDASIRNEFAAAAYRVGHTMLSPQLMRLDDQLEDIAEGMLPLRDAFFNPAEVIDVGIEPYLRGLTWQYAQEVDCFVIDDVRNFLFGPPGAGGFDLASLNIQRGRDHGLPHYNAVRNAYGLPNILAFAEMTSDPVAQARLTDVYGTAADLDLWVAGLAEEHVPGAMVGETFWTILTDQFRALRDGDRFWYQNYLPPELHAFIETQTLAVIIRRNTTIGDEIPDDVFVVGFDTMSNAGGGGGGGCFIATAAYGTPMAKEIDQLRVFRDDYLLTNIPGIAFVDTYYRLSPKIADTLSANPALKIPVRLTLQLLLFLLAAPQISPLLGVLLLLKLSIARLRVSQR